MKTIGVSINPTGNKHRAIYCKEGAVCDEGWWVLRAKEFRKNEEIEV
jgi:hypothetical protein